MGSGLPGRILVLGAALAVGLGASGARGEPAKWDQKRVASIAEQLRVGINALYDNVIKLPPNNSPLQRKVRFQFR